MTAFIINLQIQITMVANINSDKLKKYQPTVRGNLCYCYLFTYNKELKYYKL